MRGVTLLRTGAWVVGGLALLAGVVNLILAPIVGDSVVEKLWGVEPLTYVGAVLVIAGLAVILLSYAVPHAMGWKEPGASAEGDFARRWSEVTQQYFDLFDHDLGRPLRRILGKERESRAVLDSAGTDVEPAVGDLLDEIERQGPNFRLMLSNIRVLVEMEGKDEVSGSQPVEPAEVVRRIVDRYSSQGAGPARDVTWWTEPSEFGIVYSDSSAVEHIVSNLVDNAVRFATSQVEVKITRNPSHFFVRVWDDGPGIGAQYLPHVFDRGWTPEVARREERSSSGLGLYIARSLARRYGGDVTVETLAEPDAGHHTAFLVSLPLGGPSP